MHSISSKTKISDILREHPELTDYLLEIGLCSCEYGPVTGLDRELGQAAQDNELDIRSVLDELNRRIG